MALQDQPSKAVKKECQYTKINLDKYSSPYLNIMNKKKRLENTHLFIKWLVQV